MKRNQRETHSHTGKKKKLEIRWQNKRDQQIPEKKKEKEKVSITHMDLLKK